MLNFGVHGYGTSQSLLRYENGSLREDLDHVFYVYCNNDLQDDQVRGLFRLDETGQLARVYRTRSGVSTLLSKLHLSYLALDATGRLRKNLTETAAEVEHLLVTTELSRYAAERREVPQSAFPLFRQLLRRFKAAVEESGGRFYLVWLPRESNDTPSIAPIVHEEGVEAVNLRDCFGELDPAHLSTPWQSSPYRFAGRDQHWNEAGNRLAAVCLRRFLEGRLGLSPLTVEEVDAALGRYYSAFEMSPEVKTQAVEPTAATIRGKYLALERGLDMAELALLERSPIESRLEVLRTRSPDMAERLPGMPSPDKLVIRSHFNVYLHDGWLTYVKPGCAAEDFDSRFFLHVVPVDVEDLPPHRLESGFHNLDFFRRPLNRPACTVWRKLPSYDIERIRTGQFSGNSESGYRYLWRGEHSLRGSSRQFTDSTQRT